MHLTNRGLNPLSLDFLPFRDLPLQRFRHLHPRRIDRNQLLVGFNVEHSIELDCVACSVPQFFIFSPNKNNNKADMKSKKDMDREFAEISKQIIDPSSYHLAVRPRLDSLAKGKNVSQESI